MTAAVTVRANGLTYTDPDAVTAVHVDCQAPRSGQTVSGYGGKLATPYRLTYAGRNRRVYAMSYGNAASLYVIVGGAVAHLDTDTEHDIAGAREGVACSWCDSLATRQLDSLTGDQCCPVHFRTYFAGGAR